MRIAIIGGGVAGISAAYILSGEHDVTIFEKNNYLGGHTNTIVLSDGPDAGTAIDTGFIVLNDRTYPTLHRFLELLEVPIRSADMSFGFYCEKSGLQYAGTGISGLFAQPRNALSPSFLRMLYDLRCFNKRALEDLSKGGIEGVTLREYVDSLAVSKQFVSNYLVPMGAAIWSSPDQGILDFPAQTFVEFFSNHGLLTLSDRPQWQTVVGGSQEYVRVFLEGFSGQTHLGTAVKEVTRNAEQVFLNFDEEESQVFDAVVMASHADQSLHMLGDASQAERDILGAFSYQKNHTVLHSDRRVLPPSRKAWASWNYTRENDGSGDCPVSVSYHMNRLQGFESENEYSVTLNRKGHIDSDKMVCEIDYYHPVFTNRAIKAQVRLDSLQGDRNTYYAGSYFGFGFHEDAVCSGVAVASKFGLEL